MLFYIILLFLISYYCKKTLNYTACTYPTYISGPNFKKYSTDSFVYSCFVNSSQDIQHVFLHHSTYAIEEKSNEKRKRKERETMINKLKIDCMLEIAPSLLVVVKSLLPLLVYLLLFVYLLVCFCLFIIYFRKVCSWCTDQY